MREVRVESWGELHEALFAGGWDERLGRFRPSVALHFATSSTTLVSAMASSGASTTRDALGEDFLVFP